MSNDSFEVLELYRGKINDAIADFFQTAQTKVEVDLSTQSKRAIEHLAEFCQRPGKRIRGSLAALSYDTAMGEQYSKVGIGLAVSLELMQAYLLIVDDVMDKSETRRGKPTLHYRLQGEADEFTTEHETNMQAINIGLLAQHFASLQLAELDVPAEVKVAAFGLLHKNIGATGFGQLDDLYQQTGRMVSEADIIRKYKLKSSYYTFVNPLQLGLTLAGKGSEASLAACLEFGGAAGIAFQLHDDDLGIFGDAQTLGKSNLDDIREGKFTLLIQYALTHATEEDVEQLKNRLGNEQLTAADLTLVQDILIRSGAREHAQSQTKLYAAQAKASLENEALGDAALQQFLSDIVDYATERKT